MGCVLCEIAVDESHPHVVTDDEATVTILNLRPAVDGHLMVLPRHHVADAWGCPAGLYQRVYTAVHAAAARLRERLDGVAGITIVEAVRPAGWQSIPHLHVHVLPRRTGDGLQPIWVASTRAAETDLMALRERLTG